MGIVFVGGVHGVGKSTACTEVATVLDLPVHSASAMIRAERAAPSPDQGKSVADVVTNQQWLIRGLRKRLLENAGLHILDGHFALRSSIGRVECIGLNFFDQLDIEHVVCFQDNPAAIVSRLSKRDGYRGTVGDVAELQDMEIRHAALVARHLSLSLHVLVAFDDVSLKRLLSPARGR